MDLKLVDSIVNAVLYEGYMLYPYRQSAVKNQQRWNFGVLYPESYCEAQRGAEAWRMQIECLVIGDRESAIDIKARFLHLLARQPGVPISKAPIPTTPDDTLHSLWSEFHVDLVSRLEIDGQVFEAAQEAVQRDAGAPGLCLAGLLAEPKTLSFSFPSSSNIEALCDSNGDVAGVWVRKHQAIEGSLEVSAAQVGDRLFKVTSRVINRTPLDDSHRQNRGDALMRSLVSTHTILAARQCEFVSLIDPPEEFREAASGCENIGAWPVLVGSEGDRDGMLASPIILYDYPQIAPESAGDFYDGTEIDEMLALRVLTLTDEEKQQMRAADERTRRILERTETLPPEHMMKLHGAVRGLRRANGEDR